MAIESFKHIRDFVDVHFSLDVTSVDQHFEKFTGCVRARDHLNTNQESHIVWELKNKRQDELLSGSFTYRGECQEAIGVFHSNELHSVDGSDSVEDLWCDEATVDHGLHRAVRSINQVFFLQSW